MKPVKPTRLKLTMLQHALRIGLCVVLFASGFICHAETILLISSGNGDIYSRFEKKLLSAVKSAKPENKLKILSVAAFEENFQQLPAGRFSCVVTTGVQASLALSRANYTGNTVMAMLPLHAVDDLLRSKSINCTSPQCHAVVLDQPAKRQLRLLALAFPDRKRITVIGSKYSQSKIQRIEQDAPEFNLSVKSIYASNEDELIDVLNNGLSDTNILMTLPDPAVYNRNTARAVLLSTFSQRIPLFAYSRSFVLAGATLGLYSTPEDIALYVADLLDKPALAEKLPRVLYPKYFSIDINQRAADALGVTIPDASYLLRQLTAHEK